MGYGQFDSPGSNLAGLGGWDRVSKILTHFDDEINKDYAQIIV